MRLNLVILAICSVSFAEGRVTSGSRQPPQVLPAPFMEPRPSEECISPLEKFCKGKCPSFDEHLAQLKDDCTKYPVQGVLGECGDHRYTSMGDGFVSQTALFNKRGDLMLCAHVQ